jgi:hypothetical protein
MKLHVILRTCEKEVPKQGTNQPTVQQLPRICGDDRKGMVLKCAKSLVNAINNCVVVEDIKLTVLDDNSIESFLVDLREVLSECSKEVELISLETKGFKQSALKQFEMCAESEDMVYSVEDDYLHEENALNSMLVAYNYLTQKYPNPIALYPYDCAFRYDIGREYLTVLLYDGVRYWRQIRHTANTIFAHQSFFKDNFEVFKGLALTFPDAAEDQFINKLYENYEEGTGSVKAFSPIPSVAYHLSFNEPATIRTTHLGWRDLWDRIT